MSAEEVTEAHKGVGCRDLFVAATNAIEAWDVLTDTLRPNAFHNIKTAVEELRDALFAINPSVADYCKHWEVRAERAEAELADLKANNRFQRGHSEGYAEAKADCEAELATERARLDWLMAGGVCMVQHTGGFHVSRLHAPVSRAAIDKAMKEEIK